jgi:hypothetical protein
MFAFDRWADWLKSEAEALRRDGLSCEYRDNRDVPEAASNPSFGLEVETARSLGWLRYWKLGTCDYQLMDKATGELTANEAMLDANDETVTGLFTRFRFRLDQAEQ